MFNFKKKEERKEESKPIFNSYILQVSREDDKKLKEYWFDNNFIIPIFNSWDELYLFLKDENKSLASKLEVINNLDCIGRYNKVQIDKAIPDYFWQDVTLDRKIRAFCRVKSQAYAKVSTFNYENRRVEISYERLVKGLDEDLFLGICELGEADVSLFDSEEVTFEQKELIVRNAINFKKSFNRQGKSNIYPLLVALEKDIFNEELKKEIYENLKENILLENYYAMSLFAYPTFLRIFFTDSSVRKEDKIKILNLTLPDIQGNDYTKQYLFYLGNKNIPSYIQRIVLNHFCTATGYNLTYSYPETFRLLDASSFISILMNPDIDMDLKLKYINANSNPVMISYALMAEGMDEILTKPLLDKLETMKISETKEVIEIIKTLIGNPEICQKRLIMKQEI